MAKRMMSKAGSRGNKSVSGNYGHKKPKRGRSMIGGRKKTRKAGRMRSSP